jgi:hypothetical protein
MVKAGLKTFKKKIKCIKYINNFLKFIKFFNNLKI